MGKGKRDILIQISEIIDWLAGTNRLLRATVYLIHILARSS